MGKRGSKKKRSRKKEVTDLAQLKEELVALAAIFAEDFCQCEGSSVSTSGNCENEQRYGFSICVAPCSTEACEEGNHVELHCNPSRGYPSRPMQFQLEDKTLGKLSEGDIHRMERAVAEVAEECSSTSSVAAFAMAERLRDVLSEILLPQPFQGVQHGAAKDEVDVGGEASELEEEEPVFDIIFAEEEDELQYQVSEGNMRGRRPAYQGTDATGQLMNDSIASSQAAAWDHSLRQVLKEVKGADEDEDMDHALSEIKKELWIATLLANACPPSSAPTKALQEQLFKEGILPRWLLSLLHRRPNLVKRALTRAMPAAVASFDRALDEDVGSKASSSSYRANFEEIRPLGRGAFGEVSLCLHRIDGKRYAVKKIALSPSASGSAATERIMREAKLLSRLEHGNVVRYHQAWRESAIDAGVQGGSDASVSYCDPTSNAAEAFMAAREVLLIQMEFLPTSLAEQIENRGQVDVQEVWHWLRNLLDGLAYIHSQGVAHRDLKMTNIFVSASGDLKIGDFGLARTQHQQSEQVGHGNASEGNEDASGLSGPVGTALYAAPEVSMPANNPTREWQQWLRQMDHTKCDIFSLGVILYELLNTFSTRMERVLALQRLRQVQAVPEAFKQAYPSQSRLIEMMIASDPASRPSSAEILNSNLIPANVGGQGLSEVLRSIEQGHAETVGRVLDCCFSNSSPLARAAERHRSATCKASWRGDGDGLTQAISVLESSFIAHGASRTSLPEVEAGFTGKPDVSAILPGGGACSLRGDLRGWFAARACTEGINDGKRFEVGRIFRQVKPFNGISSLGFTPREEVQADFDSLCGTVDDLRLAVAESASAVIGALTRLRLDFRVICNHRHILQAAFNHCNLPPGDCRRAAAKRMRNSLFSSAAPSSQHSSLVEERLEAISRLGGPANEAAKRLKGALGGGGNAPNLSQAQESIQDFASALSALGVSEDALILWPLLTPAKGFASSHSGDAIHFEVHAKGRLQQLQREWRPIAAGGTYALWEQARPKPLHSQQQHSQSIASAGCSVSATAIARLFLFPSGQQSFVRDELGETTAVVTSRGGGRKMKDERLRLVGMLREEGVSAEALCGPEQSTKAAFELAARRGAKYLVIADKAELAATHRVRLRPLLRGGLEEVEVPEDELALRLKRHAHDQAHGHNMPSGKPH